MREIALLFAREAAGDARALLARSALRRELDAFRGVHAERLHQMAGAQSALLSAQQALELAQRAAALSKRMTWIIYGALPAIVLAAVLAAIVHPVMFFLVLLGLVAAYGLLWRKRRALNAVGLDVATEMMRRAEHQLNLLQVELSGVLARIAEMERTLAQPPPAPSVKAVGRAFYAIEQRDLAGYRVLEDRIGHVSAPVELRMPDFAVDLDALHRVQSVLEQTANAPILLAPAEEQFSVDEGLHGEEHLLEDALRTYGELLLRIPTISASASLVSNNHPLMSLFQQGQAVTCVGTMGPRIRPQASRAAAHDLRGIEQATARARQFGANASRMLADANRLLRERLDAYRGMREHALDAMHDRFIAVMDRTALLSVHCYDPRQIGVPKYFFSVIGIALEDAHELSAAELVGRLQANADTARRLRHDPGLMDRLNGAYQQLQTMAQQIEAFPPLAVQDAQDLVAQRAHASALRAMESQAEQVLETFRRVLREIVTGRPDPLLELGTQSKLHYDPVQQVWISAVDGRVYDEHTARMGQVLRWQSDLILPMWNQLWIEQEQFRKAELFRTNEALQQMGEKESVQLINIAESYKADLRPVRENLVRYSTEATTRFEQLEDTVEGLLAMGHVPPSSALRLRQQVATIAQVGVDGPKRRAERQELLLSLEARNQLERRAPAADPISRLLGPSILFGPVDAPESAALLPAEMKRNDARSDEYPGGTGHMHGSSRLSLAAPAPVDASQLPPAGALPHPRAQMLEAIDVEFSPVASGAPLRDVSPTPEPPVAVPPPLPLPEVRPPMPAVEAMASPVTHGAGAGPSEDADLDAPTSMLSGAILPAMLSGLSSPSPVGGAPALPAPMVPPPLPAPAAPVNMSPMPVASPPALAPPAQSSLQSAVSGVVAFFNSPVLPAATGPGTQLFIELHGKRHPFHGEEVVLGRDASAANLVVEHELVSRRHCRVVRRDGRFVVEDLGSRNGFEFLGQRVASHVISDGDDIYLCGVRVRFTLV